MRGGVRGGVAAALTASRQLAPGSAVVAEFEQARCIAAEARVSVELQQRRGRQAGAVGDSGGITVAVGGVATVPMTEIKEDVAPSQWFAAWQILGALFSFATPGVLGYYDPLEPAIYRATAVVVMVNVLFVAAINLVEWCCYRGALSSAWATVRGVLDAGKFCVSVAALVVSHGSGQPNANALYWMTHLVMMALLLEATATCVRLSGAVYTIFWLFSQRFSNLLRVTALLFGILYLYSFLGYMLFRDLTPDDFYNQNIIQAETYFSTLEDSFITLFGFANYFDSSMVRAFEAFRRGSIVFFVSFTFAITYVLINLLLAVIVTVLAEFQTMHASHAGGASRAT